MRAETPSFSSSSSSSYKIKKIKNCVIIMNVDHIVTIYLLLTSTGAVYAAAPPARADSTKPFRKDREESTSTSSRDAW